MDLDRVFTLLLAVGLGLLVGLQRERVDVRLAGLRTFPLITLLGALAAMLSEAYGGWVLGGAFVALAAVIVIGNVMAARRDELHPGITSEVAVLVMFAVGALLHAGPREVAVVVGGGVAVLLYAKPVMRSVFERIGEEDIRAIMQFALVALVVLPLLPDRTYGPFDVLNPRVAWLMVVLVVGVNLGGYIVQRLAGERTGAVLAGLIGGVVSSTASTVGFSRRTAGARGSEPTAALVIMLATTVVYGRVAIEVVAAGPSVATTILPPIAVAAAGAAALSVLAWTRARHGRAELPHTKNPADLRAALWFGATFVVVLLLVAAARHYFGERSVYVVALLSGLTDMDAITLSTARLAEHDKLSASTAFRAILLGSLANLGFKLGIVWTMGTARLGRELSLAFGLLGALTLALILLWP